MKASPYFLLTFYKFVDISNPHEVVRDHGDFCKDIGMKGRIYIGEEGISATVTGNAGQCHAYRLYLQSSEYFNTIADIDEKTTVVDGHCFEKMICKYRKEIVVLGQVVTADEVKATNKELPIYEFQKIVNTQDPNWVILDMRNDYEYKLGHFKGAIPSGTVNFREVEAQMEGYKKQFAGKKVLMYCTGGIRCEKLSVLLDQKGFDNIYALEGGVVKYTNLINDGAWLGNLYTFDGRVSTHIGDASTHTTIGRCLYSNALTDTCENCRYSPCNARIIVDAKQYKKHLGFCSSECYEKGKQDLLIKEVSWDPINYTSLRGLIKSDPTQKQAIISNIDNVFRKKLSKVSFNHATSQKEELIAD